MTIYAVAYLIALGFAIAAFFVAEKAPRLAAASVGITAAALLVQGLVK